MTERILLPLLLLAALAPVSAPAVALHDPTRPTDPELYFGRHAGAAGRPWILHSILNAPDRRIAIINGKRVREGERIGSARVLRIGTSDVLLQTGKRRLTLRLLPASTRVTP